MATSYIVMADIAAYIAMVHIGMACIVIAHIAMENIAMAYPGMACIALAYVVMTYIVAAYIVIVYRVMISTLKHVVGVCIALTCVVVAALSMQLWPT